MGRRRGQQQGQQRSTELILLAGAAALNFITTGQTPNHHISIVVGEKCWLSKGPYARLPRGLRGARVAYARELNNNNNNNNNNRRAAPGSRLLTG